MLKKTFENIAKIHNPQKFQEFSIREKSFFFKTDFCKNPNPTPKFDGLSSLIN